MSGVRGKVGGYDLEFVSPPRGDEGVVQVKVDGKPIEVRWRRDDHGFWIETPTGVSGLDVRGVREDGVVQYEVSQRRGDATWSALRFSRAGEVEATASAGGTRAGKSRVRAQMPGKIVRVLVRAGDRVEKDQPLLVMEAMKMENEIRAPAPGTIGEIKVSEGQAVDSGADLVWMS